MIVWLPRLHYDCHRCSTSTATKWKRSSNASNDSDWRRLQFSIRSTEHELADECNWRDDRLTQTHACASASTDMEHQTWTKVRRHKRSSYGLLSVKRVFEHMQFDRQKISSLFFRRQNKMLNVRRTYVKPFIQCISDESKGPIILYLM